MKKFWLVGLALATALTIAPAAQADTFYFGFAGSAVAGLGGGPGVQGNIILNGSLLTSGAYSGTGYNITNASGSVTIGVDTYSITGIVADTYLNNAPEAYYYTSAGATGPNTIYDDILIPITSPYVDSYGLLFTLSNGGFLTLGFDNWGDAYNNQVIWNEYVSGNWLLQTDSGGDPVGFGPVPEPSSMLLLGTGLFCMAGFLFRKALPSVIRAE
jgi:hypothetical protein